MIPIDFSVCIAGSDDELLKTHVNSFICSLNKCNLDEVNVFITLRDAFPIKEELRTRLNETGFNIVNCPLPKHNSIEDVSRCCDWMVENNGSSEWTIISHFDIVFHGDYIGWVRSLISSCSMIGNHHDGIMAIKRESYRECKVGFCGVDNFVICENVHNELVILPISSVSNTKSIKRCLALDVGQLLALRMSFLGFKHILSTYNNDPYDYGKSNLLTHARSGSRRQCQQVSNTEVVKGKLPAKTVVVTLEEVIMQTQLLPGSYDVTAVHYTHFVGGLGNGWRIACMPGLTSFTTGDALRPNFQRTNDRRAVNCPACKRSSVYVSSTHDVNEPPR